MNLLLLLKKTFVYQRVYYPLRMRQIKNVYEQRHAVFVKNGEAVLQKFVECMNQNKVAYWLEFGSLLGPFRDGEFVPNELDLDVGVFLSDAKQINRIMVDNGFVLCREFHVIGENGLEQTYEYNGVTIDLMFFYEENGEYWCNGAVIPMNRNNGRPFTHQVTSHHFAKFVCRDMEFKGMKVSVPANTEQHLIEIFGPGYKVYDPNFKVDLNKTFYPIEEKLGIGFFKS